MDMSPPVGRFAPTPSGRLHLGNLMCALVAYASVKKRGGRFLLRIEDLDAARCPFMGENTQYVLDDLAFLGLSWENEVLWQSARSDIYTHYFDILRQQGLVYPCYCSRAELHAATAPHRSDGSVIYDGKCRKLFEAGITPKTAKAPAMRLAVPDQTIGLIDGLQGKYLEHLPTDCGDFVLRRADGVYAYQLAVVVDDALTDVTEVVRGNDLLSSTPRQMLLQQLLGLKTPKYYHIPLLVDHNGRRLSKRDGDGNMDEVRRKYKTAAPVLGALATALGLLPTPESITLDDFVALFDWQRLPKDTAKLPEGF